MTEVITSHARIQASCDNPSACKDFPVGDSACNERVFRGEIVVFKDEIADVGRRLEVALGNDEPEVEEAESVEEASRDGTMTTEEELQAFYIIRAIAAEIVDPSRIAI